MASRVSTSFCHPPVWRCKSLCETPSKSFHKAVRRDRRRSVPKRRTWFRCKVDFSHGRSQTLDKNGHVINDSNGENISQEWRDSAAWCVKWIDEACIRPPSRNRAWASWIHQQPRFHLVAVYLRGSVARGLAKPGVSDLDLIAYILSDGKHRSFQHRGNLSDILDHDSSSKQLQHFFKLNISSLQTQVKEICPMVSKVDLRIHFISSDSSWYTFLQTLFRQGDRTHSDPPSADCLRDAFTIKCQSVFVGGPLDISQYIPSQRPSRETLDLLFSKYIRLASVLGQSRDLSVQGKALRWFLKSCLRAAVELVHCDPLCTESEFARDLVPCLRISTRRFPEWEGIAKQTLEFACLSDDEYSNGRVVSEAYHTARRFFYLIEGKYLEMCFKEPALESERQWQRALGTRNSWKIKSWYRSARLLHIKSILSRWLQTRASAIQAESFVTDPLPRIALSEFSGQFKYFDYSSNSGSVDDAASKAIQEAGHVVWLKGAARSWEALASWTPDYLRASLGSGSSVRVSNSNIFYFCKLNHAMCCSGAFPPPSWVRKMHPAEFFRVCQELKNVANTNDRIYLQSRIPEHLLADIPLDVPKWTQINSIDTFAQEPRIWVSTQGSVTAFHYDMTNSILIQICGVKRMTIFPKEILPRLLPYPLDHPLARRCRLDLSDSEMVKQMLPRGLPPSLQPVQLVLYPGDAVYFPSCFAHYTESLSFSVSVGYRW